MSRAPSRPSAPDTVPSRLDAFARRLRRRRIPCALVCDPANVRALTGIDCDSACLKVVPGGAPVLYTDFRYAPMVRRVAPELAVGDVRRLLGDLAPVRRVGYEPTMSHARFLRLSAALPRARFVDVLPDVLDLRAVKTADERDRLRAAERLCCEIWNEARSAFRPGMTERDMARLIRRLMVERGDGEAFPTIVCVGANAAECHHVPDDTEWSGREPVLVDMGVRLDGVCSDLTRNLLPRRVCRLYRRVYDLVLEANRAAIAAVRPGLTAGALDRVARSTIARGGFGRCFGHALGHGVGYEIHEQPTARKGDATVLRPGMTVTVEPGVYLEGDLGVRIEDLVLVTDGGCEVLSSSAAKDRAGAVFA